MMKEIYSKPVVEVEKFSQVDVISTSDGTNVPNPGTELGNGEDD